MEAGGDARDGKVAVLNGNGVNGAAGKAVTGLAAWGYRAKAGNAPGSSNTSTTAYYRPGDAAAAGDLAHIFGNATAAPMSGAVAAVIGPRVQVAVVFGGAFKGKLAVAAPHKQTKQPTGPPSTITPTT